MPDVQAAQNQAIHNSSPTAAVEQLDRTASRARSGTSFRDLWHTLRRHRDLMGGIVGGLLLAGLVYCLLAPRQYEAQARVELRTAPSSALSFGDADPPVSPSLQNATVQLETTADVLRSEKLAWHVITDLSLYKEPGFAGDFVRRFPGFRAESPSIEARGWLLRRFERRLNVETLPRTLLIQVRFRSADASLSAAVVNRLITAYVGQDRRAQLAATAEASEWLQEQLAALKTRVDRNELQLAAYESAHGILSSPDTLGNGQPGEIDHSSTLLQVDELSRQLVAATSDRILREAEYRAASEGDPELVMANDPGLQTGDRTLVTSLLERIRSQRSALEQEQAQLSAEHGSDFPRVVEIQREVQDLDSQEKAQDAKLVQRFRSAWRTAADREQLVRKSLAELTGQGAGLDAATARYQFMREEAESSHALYMLVLSKVQEAGLAAGVHSSNITVVDPATPPDRPVAPNLPLYMAIILFVSLWLALAAALLADALRPAAARLVVALVALLAAGATAHAQAPTPSTSGLPTGVASFPQTPERKSVPNPREAPAVWNGVAQTSSTENSPAPSAQFSAVLPAPIAPGDSLDVSEFHTPEFHSEARVEADGTVTLPLIGEVHVAGLDEQGAARLIEKVLIDKHMLLHPLVSVTVTVFAGQDVSVLGEVRRPGIYPYTLHHQLLDLISAASGLTPNAGRLVDIFHRSDPKTPHAVVLDPGGTDAGGDHNPELKPGDTVQVSRAGLVYVIGAVVRPGGFAVDPAQGLTVVQALSLAWGPSQIAATTKALLIREQNGGRTMISLNLKRLLRGKDPDEPIRDRDILFVPDSTAKNLLNRTMESAIQSTIGVTIYSGLVYSQRY
ncbi:MAG TPA: polysaccharide biosynthesis/export family protein [Terracidiphilus sp.]|nr:polysaccharide biosynthesis/export family protein [Terracidiphilus sp.]